MLHFMKSAPSQGQVNSPNAQPPVPRAAAELRPWAPLPENGLRGRGAAMAQALGKGDAGLRIWHQASPLSASPPPCPTLRPCAGSWPCG